MKRPVCEQYTRQDHPMGNAENILQYYKYNIYIYIYRHGEEFRTYVDVDSVRTVDAVYM